MKALVVDDSTVMRKVLIGALGRANITDVDQASDGLGAVSATKSKQYDIILMDWDMPNMPGIEAVRQMRENGVKTPVIMVTTEAEKSRVVEALKAGANNYVIKPFKPEALVSRILDTLAKSGG